MNSYQSQSLVHELLQSVLVLQKDAFQNRDFSHSKCQLNRKKIDTACLIFQVSADKGIGKQGKLVEF